MNKYCIVNGDDFGVSRGVNRGILEAHRKGILSSTSLMVDMPAAHEAALMSRQASGISIGLHVVLTSEDGEPLVDFDSPKVCQSQLRRQWNRFIDLMGRMPTHLDSHHNIHRDPRLLPLFLELAEEQNIPMREHSPVRYFPDFYGQWDGETHPEQISVDNLISMLAEEVGPGFTELSCHPGYMDPGFETSYAIEREMELQTLCSPIIRQAVENYRITLINYNELNELIANTNKLKESSI